MTNYQALMTKGEFTAEAQRTPRTRLIVGKVYCHRCFGFGSGASDLDRHGCAVCRGSGILRRERFGVMNPIPQHLDGNDAVEFINGMPVDGSLKRPFTGGARDHSIMGNVSIFETQTPMPIYASEGSPLSGDPLAPVECRMPVGLDAAAGAPSEVMVMPGGTHKITASQDGKPITVTVKVGPDAAVAMQSALEAHRAAGPQRPWFDFDHAKGPASAWPMGFAWRESPTPGVYATVEWSKAGSDAIQGKMYRAFSPVFHVDSPKNNPARVTGAPLNMGALVNDPAFKAISPLWASNRGAEAKTKMTPEELAALQGRLKQLEKENAELKASQASSANAAEITAKNEEINQLKQSLTKVKGEILARHKAEADVAVKAAVARGALPPKDEAIQAKWRGLIEADPSNQVLLASLPGNPALKPITAASAHQGAGAIQSQGDIQITREDSQRVLLAYAQEVDPLKRGEIYASAINPRINAGEDFSLTLRPEYAVQASNSIGTLAGDIVSQRSLELLRIKFPIISRISTNLSGEPVKFGQAVRVRKITVPSVVSYNTTTGYASSDATAADVPVTINADKAVQISYQNQELGSTSRNLFEEQSQAQSYALGKDLVDAIYALLIAANYTNSTTQALVGFARAAVIAMGGALDDRGVPDFMRTLLLIGAYYDALAADTVVVSNLYNGSAGDAIRTGQLPEIHNFIPVRAPNLPSTGNMTGFALAPSAVCLAVRTPDDYTKVFPGVTGGAITKIITEPNTGLSLLQVLFVDNILARAYGRLAWQYGVAKGDPSAGQLLKSA